MSLINDALKKAQKQRTGEAPSLHSMPSVGGESPQRIARRAKPAGFNTLILRAGIGGAVAVVLVVGAYFALRGKPEAGNPKPESRTASNVGSPLAGGPSAPAPQVPSPSVQASAPTAPTFTLKTEPVAKAEPVAQKPETGSVKPEGPGITTNPAASPSTQGASLRTQVSAAAPAAPPEPPKPALKLEPRAIQYIENLKIAGVRVSATDAKVLMNDRVYRIGSTVEAEMGLKLVEIAPGALTFEDERGGRYTRNF